MLCPSCVVWRSDIDSIRSPLQFEGLSREIIHQLKYKGLRSLALPLATILRDYLAANPVAADVIVPVPLHPKRLNQRGYNQSALLARELATLSRLPLNSSCLVRVRHKPPQAKTNSVQQRRENVVDAFSCRDSSLKEREVLLIDDVSTSGATLDACAKALKVAGAKKVCGLTFAREV